GQENKVQKRKIFSSQKTPSSTPQFTSHSPQTHQQKSTFCTPLSPKTPSKTPLHQLGENSLPRLQHPVENLRDIAHRIHRVLVMHPLRPDHSNRPPALPAHPRRSRNQHQPRHLRRLRLQIEHHPNTLLPSIDIRVQQLHHPL